ncbi:MAG: DUF599 domain-containing protein [Rhodobacterales bacterium]|nr:DUF599 domain-containing protein [Rhodobacterales bacterium]MDX5500241.1 DUF599 domain-containing protein [Rhodobacterales bacterium]
MTLETLVQAFTPFDALALALLLAGWLGLGWLIEHPPRRRPSVAVLMADVRRDWMRTFVTRQPRIFDANVIDSLRQSTAFFASATMIAMGGGVALMGDTERLAGFVSDFTLQTSRQALETKLLIVLLLVANALLKFVWANRLFGYCSILMASVPNDPEDAQAYPRAAQAAEVNITAARSFNRGLQSVYFALAALAWLAGPLALTGAVLLTCAVMARREFASESRGVILGGRAG